MWRFLTCPFRWVIRWVFSILYILGISFALAGLVDLGVHELFAPTPTQEWFEYPTRQTPIGSLRSCHEIYESETYEIFEALCRKPANPGS